MVDMHIFWKQLWFWLLGVIARNISNPSTLWVIFKHFLVAVAPTFYFVTIYVYDIAFVTVWVKISIANRSQFTLKLYKYNFVLSLFGGRYLLLCRLFSFGLLTSFLHAYPLFFTFFLKMIEYIYCNMLFLVSPNQQQHSNVAVLLCYPKLFICALYPLIHINFKPTYFAWTQNLPNSISSVPTKRTKICCAFLLYLHLATIMCNLYTLKNYSRKQICSGE